MNAKPEAQVQPASQRGGREEEKVMDEYWNYKENGVSIVVCFCPKHNTVNMFL